MPHVRVTTREGREHLIEIEEGMTLMETIRSAGIDELRALCGGSCSCATCRVYVNAGFGDLLPSVTEDESYLLDELDHEGETARLACQIPLTFELDGLAVRIAPEA